MDDQRSYFRGVSLRLPKEVHEFFAEKAKQETRSVSYFIIKTLTDAMRSEKESEKNDTP